MVAAVPSAPGHEAAVKRLVRRAAKLTREEWHVGETWYAQEAAWLHEQADAHGRCRRRTIAAFAALSPRMQYSRNRAALVELLGGQRPAALGRSIAAAEAALRHGRQPSGPKVAAFACNLSGCNECVTVDVWAARVAGFDVPATNRQYETIAAAYRGAARRLGCAPRTLQAALWFHVRGAKPTDPDWTDV